MLLSDIFAALRWWAVLLLIGTAVLPLTHTFFRALPDRGYAFTKSVGLLLISYLFWIMGSLGFLGNTIGGIVLSIILVIALSVTIYRQNETDLFAWLKTNWGYILTVELIFAALFFLWVWVRAQNPSITATEKPMEFAFLNSATYSPQYPPLDPWLSGFAISYYYFGYVMISILGRLAAVPTAIAFNLGVAWLVAGSGIGAFGLVYNLLVGQAADEIAEAQPRITRIAIILGLLAAVALPIGGNGQMIWEVLHGNGIGSEQFWQTLNIRDVNSAPRETPRYLSGDGQPTSGWWWWRSSRVIHEHHLSGRVEEGLTPIAEFPGFSFILGDIHPHVLALPYAFLGIAVAYVWYRRDYDIPAESDVQFWEGIKNFFNMLGWPQILMTGIIIGGLSFLNTWDILIHLFLLIGAFTLARWRQTGRWIPDLLIESTLLGITFVVLVYLLYFPFYLGFSSQAGAPFILPMMMRPTRLVHYFTIFGLPLIPITALLIYQIFHAPNRRYRLGSALAVGFGLPILLTFIALVFVWFIASSATANGYVNGTLYELGLTLPQRAPDSDFRWGWLATQAIIPTYFAVRFQYIWLTLFLGGVITAVVWLWHRTLKREDGILTQSLLPSPQPLAASSSITSFILLLVLTGALLSIGPEYVYLKDNFGQRLNTIFKFYYQTWVLFGVAAFYSAGYLLYRARLTGALIAAVTFPLLAITFLFPYHGVRSRSAEYRGSFQLEERAPATLDGLAFMQRFHSDDYEAIQWLQANAEPAAVVLETTGNPYSYYARVSANTGRPTVLGWANHEFQWRGDSTNEPALRGPAVTELFETLDWNRTSQLLNDYNVSYIYVGGLEKQDHNPRGLEKFAENLDIAYQNNGVTIYHWQPD